MADDRELHRSLINNAGRKVYRRKKRHQGSVWTPANASAAYGDGVWCAHCRQRHGYMSLGFGYEKRWGVRWVILWSCPKTGTVLEEMVLGGAHED